MSAPMGRFPDDFTKMTTLVSKLGSAYQNFTTARTTIRDYLINMDEARYARVKQYLATAITDLMHAESAARGDGIQETIQDLSAAVHDWKAIGEQVQFAFTSYHETVQNKIVANFSALTNSGNALVSLNASLMTSILLDLQAAHATVTAYLSSGQENLLATANQSMSAAKTKISQADHNDENLKTALNAFSTSLDAYMEGLRKAAAHREKAHWLFNERLTPLGSKTQAALEDLHRQSVEHQTNGH